MAGEWLTATANTNMFTYEVAPVFTLMEDIILSRMRAKVGWTGGDGILVPGGALANLYSVLAARYHKVPDVKFQGMKYLPQLVMFTSEQGHFSIKRSAAIMGIGTDNVIQIRCDGRGKMLVSDLESEVEAALARGCLPFYVNATCGTTVLGAYDPVHEIADVCQKHGLWLHVDGAWGGSVLMSNKHRHLLDGIERANSMTWNPHKLMGVPLQCSAILLKDKGILQACNSMQANYLFQQDKNYDMGYDTGDKAIQCGRHNDIFKLWLMWRSKGDRGFEDHVNKVFEHAEYLRRKIKGREGFEFVVEKGELTNVCFWYVPPSMRTLQPGVERDQQINTVAPKIKARMMESGATLVGYQPLGNLPNFFRMVISNPGVTEADLDFFVEEIERLGRDL
ncbi:glutamate decarboxylase 1-like [Liolophura sinensis]|uniref:glutamate decarboxylase 1-like n=1 Tax=Liolophura sinensis TaxID=3198878 RepID=UPI0031593F59